MIKRSTTETKYCAWCGKTFGRDLRCGQSTWAKIQTCGYPCRDALNTKRLHDKRLPLIEVFAHSYIISPDTGCWNWTGAICEGYGRLTWNRAIYRAHHLSLMLLGRTVTKGQMVCHHCDNRRCVNPDHLYIGTALTNARDAKARKRNAHGETHARAKLTREAVAKIRASTETNAALALKYGVHSASISRARRGIFWGASQ